MKQYTLHIIATSVCVLIIALLFLARFFPQPSLQHCDLFFSNGVVLHHVPIAMTPQQHRQGLSGRDTAGIGMWFHFSQPQYLSFWMHNTHVPLSVGFFSAKGKLVQVEDMQPDTDDSHVSHHLVTDVLELPQGGFDRLGLIVSVRLTQRLCE